MSASASASAGVGPELSNLPPTANISKAWHQPGSLVLFPDAFIIFLGRNIKIFTCVWSRGERLKYKEGILCLSENVFLSVTNWPTHISQSNIQTASTYLACVLLTFIYYIHGQYGNAMLLLPLMIDSRWWTIWICDCESWWERGSWCRVGLAMIVRCVENIQDEKWI